MNLRLVLLGVQTRGLTSAGAPHSVEPVGGVGGLVGTGVGGLVTGDSVVPGPSDRTGTTEMADTSARLR